MVRDAPFLLTKAYEVSFNMMTALLSGNVWGEAKAVRQDRYMAFRSLNDRLEVLCLKHPAELDAEALGDGVRILNEMIALLSERYILDDPKIKRPRKEIEGLRDELKEKQAFTVSEAPKINMDLWRKLKEFNKK